MPKSPELLTAAQVAERMGCSPRTVARWVEANRLRYVHKLPGIRGALLFDPKDVAKLERELESA